MMAVGCGQSDTERLEQEDMRREAELESKKLKAELELDNKKNQEAEFNKKRLSVVGEYELKHEQGDTHKLVFLEKGIVEHYKNGKKAGEETKWSISNKEIHVNHKGAIIVWRINKDKSITYIADLDKDGKREDRPKEHQPTYQKNK